MSFQEMERGLGYALSDNLASVSRRAGMQTASEAARAIAPSALSEAGDTLNDANRIVTRVLELADRLCGPAPTAGGTDNASQYFGDGELGRLRATMRDTRQAFVFADEALSRIERELIG